jgi:hypothetical protein
VDAEQKDERSERGIKKMNKKILVTLTTGTHVLAKVLIPFSKLKIYVQTNMKRADPWS